MWHEIENTQSEDKAIRTEFAERFYRESFEAEEQNERRKEEEKKKNRRGKEEEKKKRTKEDGLESQIIRKEKTEMTEGKKKPGILMEMPSNLPDLFISDQKIQLE